MAKQMSKEEQHINVYVRIRPYSCFENKNKYSSFLEVLSKKEILSKSNYNHKRYVFDRVFDSHCSQEDIYNTIVSPLIPEVIGGYNCTVFAYGQTGTGKTYTMQGIHDKDNQVNSGIIPRSLAQIFKILNVTNTESSVKVSYLELYNEELFDLLSQSNASKAIRIFEDKMQKGSVILQGLEELSVTELNQVYKILEQGSEKRRIASTDMNSTSSRSHTVFTIVVHTREIMIDGEELVKTGKLNLVDLAGSENISKSGAIDKRAREAGNINQSLLTLGRVIKALTEKNTHVPYRESKLTRILQDSLGGRTKTSLIATISSTNVNMEETLNTLEYAMRARCIQNRPELNQKISRTALINQYTDTIEKLQKDLIAMRTGTGVYIDEDNYTKLMSDNEAQKVEISEKMSYIKKLEIEISEYTDKLHTLQASWKEAANNIEQLSNEKKILEQDLVLVKEVNEQQIKELQEFKHKHKHLADETKKLLSDIEIHAVNEDTLHKKVSYLYQTSQNNRNITSAFYSMYNKLFTELISQIDKSVVFVLKLMVNAEYLLENTSEDTYNNIKSHINNLLQLSTDIREYKVMNFNNKELLMTRFCGYFNALQKLADCIQNKSVKFCNEFDENLKSLHDIVSSFSTEKKCDFRIIISSLINIRETASSEFLIMSNILQEFHDDIIKNIDDLLFHMEKLNNKLFENYDIITALEEELDNNFHMLINSLTTMKNKCTSNLSMYKNSNAEVINNSSDLLKKIQKFKKTTKWSMDMLRNESISKLDMLQKSVNESIISSNQINDNVHLVKKEIHQSIAQCSNNALNLKNDMNDYFIGYNSSATNYHSEINQLESVDDEHYTNLNKLVDNIYLQTENVKTKSEEIISQHKTLKKHFEVLTKETTNVLKDGQTFSSNTSKDLKSLLDEFCGCKLKHPTHAGDTPQKVLPKSSLRIESLTRNCFNACNKEKAIDVIEEPNKENSSNVINIMPTAENISNTQEIHLWEYMNKNI